MSLVSNAGVGLAGQHSRPCPRVRAEKLRNRGISPRSSWRPHTDHHRLGVLMSMPASAYRRTAAIAAVLAVWTAFMVLISPAAQADASPYVVTMTPSSATVASGDSLTYTIDVGNSGGDVAQASK